MRAFEQRSQIFFTGMAEEPHVVAGAPQEEFQGAADNRVSAEDGNGGAFRRLDIGHRGVFPCGLLVFGLLGW